MKENLRATAAYLYHRTSKTFSESYKEKLKEARGGVIESSLADREFKETERQYFMATVGFTHVGKSTVACQLQNEFPHLVAVESDKIHDVINNIFPKLDDDKTVKGSAYWLRQVITRDLRIQLIGDLCKKDWWIINDSANLVRRERQQRISVPEEWGYKTALIWVSCPEKEILRRIKQEEDPHVWRELYEKIQKPRFEPPEKEEADLLLILESSHDSVEEKILPHLRE